MSVVEWVVVSVVVLVGIVLVPEMLAVWLWEAVVSVLQSLAEQVEVILMPLEGKEFYCHLQISVRRVPWYLCLCLLGVMPASVRGTCIF